jgi:hypothetical protein
MAHQRAVWINAVTGLRWEREVSRRNPAPGSDHRHLWTRRVQQVLFEGETGGRHAWAVASDAGGRPSQRLARLETSLSQNVMNEVWNDSNWLNLPGIRGSARAKARGSGVLVLVTV